jgi:hypothetical protein
MYEKPSDYKVPIVLKHNIAIGYIYFLDKNHPLAYEETGVVYYHRHIASVKIDRWLLSAEHIHHKNGNRSDNSPENLEILTKSAHCQKHHPKVLKVKKCYHCQIEFSPPRSTTKFCSMECLRRTRLRFNPTPEELFALVWQYPTIKIALMFGVSDKAIEKRCKKLGIEKPPRGYWQKQKNKPIIPGELK